MTKTKNSPSKKDDRQPVNVSATADQVRRLVDKLKNQPAKSTDRSNKRGNR